jgi:hypothetical protein
MKNLTVKLTVLTAAAGILLAVGACAAYTGRKEPGAAGRPDSPSTGSSPTDGPGDGSGAPRQQADGSITSGGGYVYGFQANPWFIGNTATVRYCVDMDESNFGTSREAAEKAIEDAISDWKDVLKKADFSHHNEEPLGTLVLGTQDFVKVNCAADDVDLRFQLGTLTSEQRLKLGNPVKFVASAVQISYDEENMRGAGFIYVAPEHGSLRPEADDLAEGVWSSIEGAILEAVLLHELGHVFGLPHEANSVMAATACEDFVTNKTKKSFESLKPFLPRWGGSYRSFLRLALMSEFKQTTGERYISLQDLERYFGIKVSESSEANSAVIVLENNQLTIYPQHTSSEPPYLSTRGSAVSRFELIRNGMRSDDSFSEIRIPRKQKIMKIPEDAFYDASYVGGSYRSLDLLRKSEIYVAGYVMDLAGSKKTWTGANLKSGSAIGGWDLSVEVVVDGRIDRLD